MTEAHKQLRLEPSVGLADASTEGGDNADSYSGRCHRPLRPAATPTSDNVRVLSDVLSAFRLGMIAD